MLQDFTTTEPLYNNNDHPNYNKLREQSHNKDTLNLVQKEETQNSWKYTNYKSQSWPFEAVEATNKMTLRWSTTRKTQLKTE